MFETRVSGLDLLKIRLLLCRWDRALHDEGTGVTDLRLLALHRHEAHHWPGFYRKGAEAVA